jgi:hypothetical protein
LLQTAERLKRDIADDVIFEFGSQKRQVILLLGKIKWRPGQDDDGDSSCATRGVLVKWRKFIFYIEIICCDFLVCAKWRAGDGL